jgi:kinesin family protein 6/9
LDEFPKIVFQEDSDETIQLKNVSLKKTSNEEEALNLLFIGDTNKMIAETPSNPASSRSHCVFTISLITKTKDSKIRKSKLHLVDLAG